MDFQNTQKGKIDKAYKNIADNYDAYITTSKIWSKILVKMIWGMKDDDYVSTVIPLLSDDFEGRLLDIPAGTAVFTHEKYKQMKNATITCMDYSAEMLNHARKRMQKSDCGHIQYIRGDVGQMPFEDSYFDIVLSMNGVHAFPEKEKAFDEIFRVLKSGGQIIGCFYIKDERRITDFFINRVLAPGGTFTPPFMNKKELEALLDEKCTNVKIWNKSSIVCFCGVRR